MFIEKKLAGSHIPDSNHVFLGQLIDDIETLDKNINYITMCATGIRATVAASILQYHGFNSAKVFLGSMWAWNKAGFETHQPARERAS